MKRRKLFCRHGIKTLFSQRIVEGNILVLKYFCPECGRVIEKECDFEF